MAVEDCNQAGGISGRQVQLIARDDEQNSKTAKRAMKELIEAGVVAVIGPMTSDMAMAIVPMANEARIPLVSPTVATDALTDLDDYFFRTGTTISAWASKNAAYQIKSGNMRRVAAAWDTDNANYSQNWLDVFRKPLPALAARSLHPWASPPPTRPAIWISPWN